MTKSDMATTAEIDAAYDTLVEVAGLHGNAGDQYDLGMAGIVRRAIDRSRDNDTRARVDFARITLSTHPQYGYLRNFCRDYPA